MGSKRKPSRIEAVETALRETGGVTVTGGAGLPTVVRGAPLTDRAESYAPLPMPDVQTAVGPEAIDRVLAEHPTLPSPVAPMDGAAKGIRWELPPEWSDRVDRMAQSAGMPPERFLESLLRRAWTQSGAGKVRNPGGGW